MDSLLNLMASLSMWLGIYVTDTNNYHIQEFSDKRAGRCEHKVV